GLRAHYAIVASIHDAGPSLPSQFGQVFSDEAALARALDARHAELRESLERVGDRVEMSLTLAWNPSVPASELPEPRTGREFLVARAAREGVRRQAEMTVERLLDLLASDR